MACVFGQTRGVGHDVIVVTVQTVMVVVPGSSAARTAGVVGRAAAALEADPLCCWVRSMVSVEAGSVELLNRPGRLLLADATAARAAGVVVRRAAAVLEVDPLCCRAWSMVSINAGSVELLTRPGRLLLADATATLADGMTFDDFDGSAVDVSFPIPAEARLDETSLTVEASGVTDLSAVDVLPVVPAPAAVWYTLNQLISQYASVKACGVLPTYALQLSIPSIPAYIGHPALCHVFPA